MVLLWSVYDIVEGCVVSRGECAALSLTTRFSKRHTTVSGIQYDNLLD